MSNARSDSEDQKIIARLQAEITALRESRRRLYEAAFADRQSLERTLHDGLQQRLIALAVEVQHLASIVDRRPRSAKPLLEDMAGNLREAVSEAATLARMLFPPLLDGRGLATSLLSAAAGAGVTVVVDIPPGAVSTPEVGVAIYWTCLEALAAASRGSEATIGVREEADGVAFDLTVVGSQRAELVDRLRDRIEALDGYITVDQAALGARFHGWLPLSRSARSLSAR